VQSSAGQIVVFCQVKRIKIGKGLKSVSGFWHAHVSICLFLIVVVYIPCRFRPVFAQKFGLESCGISGRMNKTTIRIF
jgi:hypothetical protein